MTRRLWLLPVLLIPVLIVATFPAAVVMPQLDLPANVTQVRGSIWSGSASWQQPGWQPLEVRWRWRSSRDWHWQAVGGDTHLEGEWRAGRTTVLPTLSGRIELDRLDLAHWLAVARPTGTLELDLTDIVFAKATPPSAAGKAVWRQAALAGAIQESLGEIEIAVQDEPSPADGLGLAVRSLVPAAVQVRGTIVMDRERYQADLWLRSAAGRSDLTSALAVVGELQPDGQVRLRVGGRIGLQ